MSLFLSTPSVRRATNYYNSGESRYCISIHALRAEGDPFLLRRQNQRLISIHALRAEGDPSLRRWSLCTG